MPTASQGWKEILAAPASAFVDVSGRAVPRFAFWPRSVQRSGGHSPVLGARPVPPGEAALHEVEPGCRPRRALERRQPGGEGRSSSAPVVPARARVRWGPVGQIRHGDPRPRPRARHHPHLPAPHRREAVLRRHRRPGPTSTPPPTRHPSRSTQPARSGNGPAPPAGQAPRPARGRHRRRPQTRRRPSLPQIHPGPLRQTRQRHPRRRSRTRHPTGHPPTPAEPRTPNCSINYRKSNCTSPTHPKTCSAPSTTPST